MPPLLSLQNQALYAELHIIKEFEKLHTYLHEQEAEKIQILREEREHKIKPMEDKMERLCREINSLQEAMEKIEKEMETNNVLVLQVR